MLKITLLIIAIAILIFGLKPLHDNSFGTARQLTDQPLQFKDPNFKLAVIHVLMYQYDSFETKVDPWEFASAHSDRSIDIDEEGESIIPEIHQHFLNMDIYPSQVTDIYELFQDGGNDIYMTISPFGESFQDWYTIQSADDAKLLPNLKRVTLFHHKNGDDTILHDFRKQGIDARWL